MLRIIRFIDEQGQIRSGVATDTTDRAAKLFSGDILRRKFSVTGDVVSVKKLLAPIEPTAILCIGLNYRRHAAEGNVAVPKWPILFVKGNNTLQHPNDPIEIPRRLASEEVDYECELAVVIGVGPNGELCKNVRAVDALKYVAGYTAANDVSARDWQLRFNSGQWCRGKFFDTFCPLGPALLTPESIPDPNALKIATVLNGETVQSWNTNDMIFDVPTLIEFLSGSTTLLPGTVILTGTPHGVGMAAKPPRYLRAGDRVTIEIEKIGQLSNSVIDEPGAHTNGAGAVGGGGAA